MENINFRKIVEDRFYLESETSINKIGSALNLMPSFVISDVLIYDYLDVFFDTPDKFLENVNSSIRLRTFANKQILSIRCKAQASLDKEEPKAREYEMEISTETNFIENQNCLLFLEDKLREIYAHRIEMDILRVLKDLKPYLAIKTERKEYLMKNNREFTTSVCLDEITFQTRKNFTEDFCAKFKLTCFPNKDNIQFYNNLLNDVKKRVLLIPMLESKFDAGIRNLKITSFKRPEKGEAEVENPDEA